MARDSLLNLGWQFGGGGQAVVFFIYLHLLLF